jgi:hypothetical protein
MADTSPAPVENTVAADTRCWCNTRVYGTVVGLEGLIAIPICLMSWVLATHIRSNSRRGRGEGLPFPNIVAVDTYLGVAVPVAGNTAAETRSVAPVAVTGQEEPEVGHSLKTAQLPVDVPYDS